VDKSKGGGVKGRGEGTRLREGESWKGRRAQLVTTKSATRSRCLGPAQKVSESAICCTCAWCVCVCVCVCVCANTNQQLCAHIHFWGTPSKSLYAHIEWFGPQTSKGVSLLKTPRYKGTDFRVEV
jgi:hypothetical protein